MYLHTPALEVGSWWRVDTAAGSDTATTVYAHDGADAIPTSLGASGSTVRNTRADGTALFWSSASTLYCKELTYQGVPTGTVVTSTGATPTTPTPSVGVADASTSAKGIVQLAGDLAGTAAAPTVAKVGGVAVTGTPTSGQVPTATGGTAATWQTPAGGTDRLGLTPTAVKTADYTATAGDFVPVDTTSGNVTVTFPTAPADGAVVAVKQVVRGGTNTVGLALGVGDKFNTTGGATTGTLTLASQGIVAQYKASLAVWYIVADDTPLSGLDSRYAQLASPALTGTPTVPTAAVGTNTTQAASTAFVLAQASSAAPAANGVAAVGTSTRFMRADAVAPTDPITFYAIWQAGVR